nr:MAG TPA_asm: Prokaryotic lipoprotein-attachment site [Caudoviricetes sp.]
MRFWRGSGRVCRNLKNAILILVLALGSCG